MKKLAAALTMLVASLCLALPGVAFAAGPVVTHDGDEIRALLESDGDAIIRLDGDVDWSVGRMTDREMVEITLPCSHTDLIASGLHPTSHKGYLQVWATMGSGDKTIDLAGHQLHVNVDDAGTRWAESDTQLYLVDIPAGAKLTVDDSSGTDKGEIRFDGYLHAGASGAAGSQSANYYNRDVVYRNVFRVEGGALTYNGGTVSTRSKQQYISPGRSWDSLIGPAYSGNVRQQVNCTAITLLSGDVLVNGGVIEGRGYRFMYSGATNEGLWYSSEYWPAAALYAEGGTITVNAGTFNGMGGAHAFNVMQAKMAGSSIKVRSGFFHTHKVDKVLVPAADDNGGNSGTGAPRYMSQGYGTVGLHGDFIDGMISEVTVDGTTYTYDLSGAALDTSKDVTVSPAQSAQLDLYDTGTGTKVEGVIEWNGKDSRIIRFPLATSYEGYPWKDGYYQVLLESGKNQGVSAKITIGGSVHSVGGETVDSDKQIVMDAAVVAASLDSEGYATFDLRDLLPDSIAAEGGGSFVLRVRYSENLMPYDKERCAGSLVHEADASVKVKPEALQVTETGQPQSSYASGSELNTTLSAQAVGATNAWWVKVWPVAETYDNIQEGASFDSETGIATLNVPYSNTANYYRCYFSDGYSAIPTNVACVRKALTDNISSEGASVVLHQNLASGTLIVTGDLLAAFTSTIPSSNIRAVKWFKDGSAVALDERVHVVASTPHLEIKDPKLEDAGMYYADITVDFNGKPATFRTGNYTVTVDATAPAAIDKIELSGIGGLYLGDAPPGKGDIACSDPRVNIESITWHGASDNRLNVPTADYEIVFSPAEGYSFGSNIPVFMNGAQVGYTAPASGSNAAFSYTYGYGGHPDLTARNALNEFITVEQGQSGIDEQLDPGVLYNTTGQVTTKGDVESDSFDAASIVSGLTINSAGKLAGALADDATLGAYSGLVKFKTTATGSSFLKSGITIAVLKSVKPIALTATLDDITHVHTWGDWTDNGDNTHSRTCTVCGTVEVAGHNWDDGEETVAPTVAHPGVMTFTCDDCGATKAEAVPNHTHSLAFNLNGGTLDDKTGTVTVLALDGDAIELPAPTREGYVFDYWEGSRYEAGDVFTALEDHAFTAQWKQPAANDAAAGDTAQNADGKVRPSSGGISGTGDALQPTVLAAVAAAAFCIVALAAYMLRRPRKHPAHASKR